MGVLVSGSLLSVFFGMTSLLKGKEIDIDNELEIGNYLDYDFWPHH